MPTKIKLETKLATFEKDLHSMAVHVPERKRFDVEKMYTAETDKNGVYFRAIMSAARCLMRDGGGLVSAPDDRTRLRVTFSGVANENVANPSRVYEELIEGKKQPNLCSISLQLLHAILRIYGDVSTANGLGKIIPRDISKSLICPHLTTTGWVMIRCLNLGGQTSPAWIVDVDPIYHSAYIYSSGSVVMTVVP